jgi:Na+-transporting methylmalonyl-CoA/oxaloacetate decarboxylase beta subunit
MFRPQWDHQNPDSAKVCIDCGTKVSSHTSRKNKRSSFGQLIRFGFYGAFLGTLIGFLIRPSAPVVGQLPLANVLSRGVDISQLLTPVAQTSFNYLLTGLILGLLVGALAGHLLSKQSVMRLALGRAG